MPLFMDRHDIPGLTAMDVAEGHKQDLKIQHKYNCRALTYWFDEEKETAFCLIEAPNKNSVRKLHDDAHGLIPNQIIEVDPKLVETFLGRIKDPKPIEKAGVSDPLPLTEPAFRIIMVIQLKGTVLIKSKYGMDGAIELFRNHNKYFKKTLEKHTGRLVTQTGDSFIASFTSVSKIFKCAVEIQNGLKKVAKSPPGIHAVISLNAGDPVTGKKDFFGETIQLAKHLCHIASKDRIMVSSTVKNLYRKKGLDVLSQNDTVKTLHPEEENFLTRLMEVTERVWNKEGLITVDLARQIGLSKSQLYRKITSLTGFSPTQFLREFRLKRAIKLIENKQGNISQIAFETGFSNPSYFSKCFKKRFGILPSDYRNAVA